MKKSLVDAASTFMPLPQSIDQLYLGCLAQNPKAQRELFERLSPKMLSICLRYIKETAAAEDALLVAFGKVFSKIRQFSQEASFEGWVRRIVVNECLMYLGKQKAKFRAINIEQLGSQMTVISPDNSLEWEDLSIMVEKLPKGYKAVFELFALKGLSHEEISKHLHISESTSKSQLCRARIRLQKLLNLPERKN
ncbi:RNA polymerase sigma factor [Algoriphagus yeomjeoni]|uniref:RNA polymerase sigma-70 factor (ECF subfamily) n=1 Tax=Algoriphagus yeomjeoni TaxID=291403 RepID=A0A327NZ17_9BACT|nr:sigma-70 family RNA polymerase sigma factor [Algoriphagus yeomjeoni]RAI84397.1 RNA polymerase sigma-70 factor (ECF subfamily) [Algoriphagus yeomjeoni]